MLKSFRITENELVKLITKVVNEQEGTTPYELFMLELSSVAKEIEYLRFDYDGITQNDIIHLQDRLDTIMMEISENEEIMEDEVNELIEFGKELESEIFEIKEDKFGGGLFN